MASTTANGFYHAPTKPGKSSQTEYTEVKARYWQMEESYNKSLEQEKQRPDIAHVREKLLATRLACVELANERNVLLDRILQLEIDAGQAYQPPISGPLGTERESRFRDRIASALSQTTGLNSDPYANSAHCGPAAIQEYQQKFANTSVYNDKLTGPEFDSTAVVAVGKGSPSKRPAGKHSKMATTDDPTIALNLASTAPATAPTSFASSSSSHPPGPESTVPASGSSAIRIPKIRVKPITPHPTMNAPAHVPSSNSLSNLLDGNSTYRDSTTPSEAAATAPDGSASSS